MADEANGLPYNSGNSSGIGAVYFDKTVEPLRQLNENLKTLDTADDFYKMQKLKELQDAKKAKLASDITKDLSADYKGAMPEDIEQVFKPKMQELQQRYANVVKRLGGNNSNITKDPEYLQIRADINALKGGIQESSEHNKIFTADAAAYRAKPENYDDASLVDMAKGRVAGLDGRGQIITANGGTFLKPKVASFTSEALKNSDNIGKYIYDVRESEYPNDNGEIIKTESKVVNPDKLRSYVRGDLANYQRAKQVDIEFNQLPPQTQAVYALAEQQFPNLGTAKEQYAYDVHKNLFGNTRKSGITDYTPEAKEKAKQKDAEDKALYLYDVANGILTGNLDYAANVSKDASGNRTLNNLAVNAGEMTSLDLKNMNYGTYDDPNNGLQPDKIVSVSVNASNPQFVKLKTLKTVSDNAGDATKPDYKIVDKSEFPEVLFNSNFGAGAYQLVKKSAAKRGHVSATGAIVTPPMVLKTGATKPLDNPTIGDNGIVYPKKDAKQAAKNKVIEGKTMPTDATPKYSKKTGLLIGYELPDGTKFKF
jgi:hypothetical protein